MIQSNNSVLIVLLAILLISIIVVADDLPPVPSTLVGPPLVPLKEISCSEKQIQLKLIVTRVTIPNTSVSFTTRLFNSAYPGPLLRMRAGTTCKIIYNNTIPASFATEQCSDPTHSENNLHCPDYTNLHVHGLHVSPNGLSDNMNVSIAPGKARLYQYDLLEQTMPGTHWYHPHRHGSSALQTGGGATGMIIIDPASSYAMPSDIAALYQKPGRSFALVINELDLRDDPDLYETEVKPYTILSNSFPDQTIDPNVSLGDSPAYMVLVNGQYQPFLTVKQGEVNLLRMVFASGMRMIELTMQGDGSCEFVLLARDGVFHRTPYITLPYIALLQGTRADIAMRCSSSGIATLTAAPRAESDDYFGGEARSSQAVVMQFKIVANSAPAEQFPTSECPFPKYLRNINSDIPSRMLDIAMSGESESAPGVGFVNVNDMAINGVPFQGWAKPQWVDQLCLSETYRLRLRGLHPYHQHTNHFQVNHTIAKDFIVRVGEYRDVVLGSSDESLDDPKLSTEFMSMRTFDYDGIYILHCHITEHGDAGLMSGFEVVHSCPPSSKQQQQQHSINDYDDSKVYRVKFQHKHRKHHQNRSTPTTISLN